MKEEVGTARIVALVTLTMLAFAANSVLNRAALSDGAAGPAAFAALRLLSGALCLALLVWRRGARPSLRSKGRWIGASSLLLYMLGFSFAYVALDAGTGALILFGGVQITMFAGGLLMGERPAAARWVGVVIAFGGLLWLLWPGAEGAPPIGSAVMMAAAALGWGIYSLAGRGNADPLGDTAANFLIATPVALVVWLFVPDGLSLSGALLAVLSGGVTSGLGYALWYVVLPRIDASAAALSQLTVPIIAALGGVVLLSEPMSGRLILASLVVLGGVALGIIVGRQRTKGSSGS